MAIDLMSNGQRVGLRIPGFADSFNRPAGNLGGGWIDFADIHGEDEISRTLCLGDGAAGVLETANAAVTPGYTPAFNQQIGHCVFGRPMGSANGELTVEWDLPNGMHIFHQISPAFGLNFAADAHYLKMGVAHVWDAGLVRGKSYAQNVFRGPVADSYDPPLYYRVQGDRPHLEGDNVLTVGQAVPGTGLTFRGEWSGATAYNPMDLVVRSVLIPGFGGGWVYDSFRCLAAHTNQATPVDVEKGVVPNTAFWSAVGTRRFSATAAENTAGINFGPFPPGSGQQPNGAAAIYPTKASWTVRVVNNWYQTWFDGQMLHQPSPVPSWAINRDGWGVHTIDISYGEGSQVPGFPPGTFWPSDQHHRITKVLWRPYDTPLI